MHLKLPPAVVWVLAAVFMLGLDRFLPFGEFDFTGRIYFIYLFLILGGAIGLVAVIQFVRKQTTVDPTKPETVSKLVINGLYRFTRNPMYLGLLLVLLAWGVYLGNAFNTLIAAGFVSYMNKFQIQPEEEALAKTFGSEYAAYLKDVRRWF
ncbi:methyltransferase family protein [Cellulophaga baltica]|uniref:Protein-S-isoprenylcysteine O-methyltransferase Ste14 n=1 Tax=Cellulophaga baltica TaxID=76594 RepID=A0A1G7KF04_9FLAO|nr:isoprenylcysteine carboxylmethyltransferase family protein [Cellulophaga baltica]SDF35745.1 Protein-S-isoprenylcysteine O-methyltransferase Ste14 [Cellulophaga baltica]